MRAVGNATRRKVMYTCGMCKKRVEGEVALKNGAGSFCSECHAIIRERSAEGMRARSAALNGHCIWCGEKITKANPAGGGGSHASVNVHLACERNRDWALKCIRHSDRIARYVARTEERERPLREEREKAMRAAKPSIAAESVPSDDEARLRRLELMLNKLTQALGV
jgi:hypothetical protein